MSPDSLQLFHPLIQSWFKEQVGSPTDIQQEAWPLIAKGEHVLVTAPTGSGKTLCAFLWAINALVSGEWETGKIRLLYISPLKALNNDVHKNLLRPLEQLKELFDNNGVPFPNIQVQTRSGDTPGNERQKMLRRPPDILITTPESLHIILTGLQGSILFSGLHSIILDEIHNLASTKRGVLFMTAVERLVRISGEFQRIALSATVNPISTIVDYMAGFRITGGMKEPTYEKRKVAIIQSRITKVYNVKVEFPEHAVEQMENGSWWPALVRHFRGIIENNTSTLFFVNSRRISEKVTRLLNEDQPFDIAYAHHGSLSKEIRLEVENRLKRGELKAIVATSSLELGIDVGDLDEVVMVQVPDSLSSAIQRTGRAGHKVGQTSFGRIIPIHGREFLDAAIAAQGVIEKKIEPSATIKNALDVLAQLVLSMSCHESWNLDELYAFTRCTHSYHTLERSAFDGVINMLAGRYADCKIRELRPRLAWDKLENTIRAKDHVPFLIYSSGGTIPDRGYFNLRRQDNKAKIGELDEEFVWERSLGDTFVLGNQIWQIETISEKDVEVIPCNRPVQIIPFWKAESSDRDFFFSSKVAGLLEELNAQLKNSKGLEWLKKNSVLSQSAAEHLIDYLHLQREKTQADLPHRHHLLIEHYDDPLNKTERKQVILHTLWGGQVNRPFALSLSAAWEERFGYPLEFSVNNDAILLMLPHEFSTEILFDLIDTGNFEAFLRHKLEATGFFGARFRENAGRALLLPSGGFHKRMPLWLNRMRSKKLFEAVKSFSDFPIVLETWRSCLQDEFDLKSLRMILDELQTGQIKVSDCVTRKASPFCGSIVFRQVDHFMYEDDSPLKTSRSNLSDDLIKDLLSTNLRPRISEDIVEILDMKLKQVYPGYAPSSLGDLMELVVDRIIVPEQEWFQLRNAQEAEHECHLLELDLALADKVIWLNFNEKRYLAALENLNKIEKLATRFQLEWDISGYKESQIDNDRLERNLKHARALSSQGFPLQDFLYQWLGFYAVLNINRLRTLLPFTSEQIQSVLNEMREQGKIIIDHLTSGAKFLEVADMRNLEILLRIQRNKNRIQFQSHPLKKLPLFLAHQQGLARKGDCIEDLQERLEKLFGYPSPVESWEETLLPSRMDPFYETWLESLATSGPLKWWGQPKKHLFFGFEDDLELFLPRKHPPNELTEIFPDTLGHYNTVDLIQFSGKSSFELTKKLWNHFFKAMVNHDSWPNLRSAYLQKFNIEEPTRFSSSRRHGLNRWKTNRSISGRWSIVNRSFEEDSLMELERNKDRVRLLLDRYGVLFKALLDKELPPFKWKNLFKTLKLMEFSGEVIMGQFFDQIPGIQFTNHENFRKLQLPIDEEVIYWLNAKDPASMCGLNLETLKAQLPARKASNYLVFHGTKLVVTARRNARDLTLNFEPDCPHARDYLDFFKTLLTRKVNPVKKITIETINGLPYRKSPYLPCFKDFGFMVQKQFLELWRQY